MGQKVHPIGLRIGSYRKWASSWYGGFKETNTHQTFGVISTRGGVFNSGIEDLLYNLFKRYSQTKFIKSTKLVFVDFRLFKGFGGHLYGFILYTKLIGSRL